jgi:putative SOS response-associated peptidase YedK
MCVIAMLAGAPARQVCLAVRMCEYRHHDLRAADPDLPPVALVAGGAMCYSAMIKEEYAQYVRATGAEIDLDQFMEIFWFGRERDEQRTVPRAIERWFDQPVNDQQLQIRDFIVRRRMAQVAAWEMDLFAQKKRLADAERKLAVKATKAASESRRIAGRKIDTLLHRLGDLHDSGRRASDGRIFPMNYVPIVISDDGRRLIRLARYHCRLAGKLPAVDSQLPGLYNARRDNLQKYWRRAFGTSHALMLVESFYENVDAGGRNVVLHFQPRPPATMFVACLYSVWKEPGTGRELLSFAAITDDPPPEVAATGHDRMIINIKPENIDAWLNPQGRTDEELQAILSDRQTPYYEHEVLAA